MWRRFLTYPMPTIALINGHAFAGGLMTAMFHDYRVFNPLKGFLCLNELDFGVGLKPPMSSIFRQKLPSPLTYRSLVLEAKRFTAKEALAEGIVDSLGSLAETLGLIEERGLVKRAIKAYRTMKLEMWKETISFLDNHESGERREKLQGLVIDKLAKDGEKKVKEWEATLKSKL
ncbi:MAG: hypothetical protein M1829_001838 [Trizodia sp. TS-e1964]|nr:MAG: hypothetical protein M1829_001838 [Trizodia sp. TS-e1964]